MAKAKDNAVLGPEDLVLLNKVIAATAETADYCRKCEDCGIDVAKEAKINAEQQEIASKLKAKFFPKEK